MPKQKAVSYVPKPSRKVLAKLRELEETHKGWIAAVEPRSGEVFVGKDLLEAIKKARKVFSTETFNFYRIGYKAVLNLYAHQRGGNIA